MAPAGPGGPSADRDRTVARRGGATAGIPLPTDEEDEEDEEEDEGEGGSEGGSESGGDDDGDEGSEAAAATAGAPRTGPPFLFILHVAFGGEDAASLARVLVRVWPGAVAAVFDHMREYGRALGRFTPAQLSRALPAVAESDLMTALRHLRRLGFVVGAQDDEDEEGA